MNLENRPLNQTVRNVDGNIRCVVLTPQLSVAQLHCDRSQVWGTGHYLVYIDSNDSEPTIRMMKFYKELQEIFDEVTEDTTVTFGHALESLSQDQRDIILPTLSEELKEWLLNPGGKTRKLLATYLRTTEYTVVQEHNLRVIDDIFRGKTVPKRLYNLITNHRVGSSMLPDPFAQLNSLDGIEIIPSKVKTGDKDIISTDWLVFYSDGPAAFISHRHGMESTPIEHTNIVLAVQFIHDTAAVEGGWVQIKVYR